MEPVTMIATAVISVLSPYLVKGAEEFIKAAGKDAYEKAKTLLATLKSRWANDQEASEQLARFEQKPERYRSVLEDILNEKLVQDENLATDLNRLLQEMGPTLNIVMKMKDAEGVTGLEATEMSGGRASVTQEIEKGKNITGAKIARIG
jgi:outer membrane lipoprotein-sorting protein